MKKEVQITPLVTGHFRLPMAPFFGVAETVVRNKFKDSLAIDKYDRVSLAVRGLLVRTTDGIFIVEPGLGVKPHQYADKYCATKRRPWGEILHGTGVSRNDITGVLCSHLHWDHSGSNTRIHKGKILPTFPNAIYFLHARELQHAEDKDSHRLPQSYDPRDLPPKKQIQTTVAILTKCTTHIALELTGGHTPGHCMIHIEAEDRHHVFIGDIAPTRMHLTTKGGYEMAFDDEAQRIFFEKRKLIKRAKSENWRLWLVHDPDVAFIDGKDLE